MWIRLYMYTLLWSMLCIVYWIILWANQTIQVELVEKGSVAGRLSAYVNIVKFCVCNCLSMFVEMNIHYRFQFHEHLIQFCIFCVFLNITFLSSNYLAWLIALTDLSLFRSRNLREVSANSWIVIGLVLNS